MLLDNELLGQNNFVTLENIFPGVELIILIKSNPAYETEKMNEKTADDNFLFSRKRQLDQSFQLLHLLSLMLAI